MKIQAIIFTAAISLLTILSCQNSELEQKAPKLGTVTFKVGNVSTRTEFATAGVSGSAINWQTTDVLGIYDNLALRTFTVTPTAGALNTASISGTADVNASDYYGIYPESAYVSNTEGTFTFKIPAVQTATEGNYDPAANISLAHAANGDASMMFYNVGAWLKLNLSVDSVKTVKMNAIDQGTPYLANVISFSAPTSLDNFVLSTDVPLSGTFSKQAKTFSSDLTDVSGVNSVELNGTINLGTDHSYYICIPPAKLNGKGIKAHLTGKCPAHRVHYKYNKKTKQSVYDYEKDYSASIVSSLKTEGKTDLKRDNVYDMTLSNVKLTPEFYYPRVKTPTTYSGNYIIVVKSEDGKYYCMDNTKLYHDSKISVDNDYYQAIDITDYYDVNTDEFYISSSADFLKKKIIDITLDTNSNTISIDNFSPCTITESTSEANKFIFHMSYNKYIYYDTVKHYFAQRAAKPTSNFEYFSMYRLNFELLIQ